MLIGVSIKKIIWTDLSPLVCLFFQPVNPMSLHLYRSLLIFLMFNLFAVVVGFKGGVKLDMLLPSLTFPIICSFSRVLTCQGLIECQD